MAESVCGKVASEMDIDNIYTAVIHSSSQRRILFFTRDNNQIITFITLPTVNAQMGTYKKVLQPGVFFFSVGANQPFYRYWFSILLLPGWNFLEGPWLWVMLQCKSRVVMPQIRFGLILDKWKGCCQDQPMGLKPGACSLRLPPLHPPTTPKWKQWWQ